MRQYLKHILPKNSRLFLLKTERLISLIYKPRVLKTLVQFRNKQNKIQDFRFSVRNIDIFPIGGENTEYTSFDRHYVYHTAWAARVVAQIKPEVHRDISSSLYFSSIVSAFNQVDFYDYRPAKLNLSGLNTYSGDLMKLPFADKSIESISCMHTLEHIGLGRYGDPIDPQGDIKAINELKRVVKIDGNLILVVPVGKQRIEFNAHRVYDPELFASYVLGDTLNDNKNMRFELKEYSYIPETDNEGPIQINVDLKNGKNDNYACGCFWFKRIA